MLIAVSCLTWLDLNHQASTSPGVCHRSSKHETTQTPFDVVVVRYWRGGFGRPQNDTAVYREVGLGKFPSWVRVGKTISILFFWEFLKSLYFTTLPETRTVKRDEINGDNMENAISYTQFCDFWTVRGKWRRKTEKCQYTRYQPPPFPWVELTCSVWLRLGLRDLSELVAWLRMNGTKRNHFALGTWLHVSS